MDDSHQLKARAARWAQWAAHTGALQWSRPQIGLQYSVPEPGHQTGVIPPLGRSGSEPPSQPHVVSHICPHMRRSWFSHDGESPPLPGRLAAEARATLSELLEGAMPCTSRWSHQEQVRDRKRVLGLFDSTVRGANPLALVAGPDGPPSSFELFPALPTELRLKIWERALGRRTLSIEWGLPALKCWNRLVPMPTIARVNREARGVALKAVGVVERWQGGKAALRAWALPGDYLDIGGLQGVLRSIASFEGHISAFAGVVAGFSHFLGFHRRHASDKAVRESFKQARLILVAVQTIHITIDTAHAAAELMEYLDLDQAKPFDCKEVEPDGPMAATAFSGAQGLELYTRGHVGGPALSCVTAVVALSDRARIEELLAIGTAVGQFEGGLHARLLATRSHSNAYCLDDCLPRWWSKCGLPAVHACLQRAEMGQDDSLMPDVVPAIRFQIQWTKDPIGP